MILAHAKLIALFAAAATLGGCGSTLCSPGGYISCRKGTNAPKPRPATLVEKRLLWQEIARAGHRIDKMVRFTVTSNTFWEDEQRLRCRTGACKLFGRVEFMCRGVTDEVMVAPVDIVQEARHGDRAPQMPDTRWLEGCH